MTLQEVKLAVNQAETEIRRVECHIEDMLSLIVGRLKRKSMSWSYANKLAQLKRELRNFDAHSRKWKN